MIVPSLIFFALQNPYLDVLRDKGYYYDNASKYYLNHSRTSRIYVADLNSGVSEDRVDRAMKGFDRSSARRDQAVHTTASGLPLGRDFRFARGISQAILEVCSFQRHIRIEMSCGQSRVGGVPKPNSPMTHEDYLLVEAVGRWELATSTAGVYSSTTRTIQGKSVTARASGTIRVHLDAQRWSAIKGYTYHLNQNSGCAMISRPQGDIILPLASPKVKVGAQWIEIEDIVLADGDRPLIPMQIINRL